MYIAVHIFTVISCRIPALDINSDVIFGSYKKKKGNKTEVVDGDPSVEMGTATYCSLVESIDKECYVRSILDLWNYSEKKIKRLTKQDIIDRINKYPEQ